MLKHITIKSIGPFGKLGFSLDLSRRLTLITGGIGCGKSLILQTILDILNDCAYKVVQENVHLEFEPDTKVKVEAYDLFYNPPKYWGSFVIWPHVREVLGLDVSFVKRGTYSINGDHYREDLLPKSVMTVITWFWILCNDPHCTLIIDDIERNFPIDVQRRILPVLMREFPNARFICVTKSLAVLCSIQDPNSYYVYKHHVHRGESFFVELDPTDSDHNHYGKSYDESCFDLGIGKRDGQVQMLFDSFLSAISDRDIPKAEGIKQQLIDMKLSDIPYYRQLKSRLDAYTIIIESLNKPSNDPRTT
jgi:hypothetical protein